MLTTPAKPLQLCLPFEDQARAGLSEAGLTRIYNELLRKIYAPASAPNIEVRYFPYVGINSTIRSRQKKFFVRISDILRDAPAEVHQALATILLSKILRRRVPQKASTIFSEYCISPSVTEAHENSRQVRGRKVLSSAAGTAYDLTEQFQRLNRLYFHGALPLPRLSWSRSHTRRIFGHHDPVHNAIVVSKSLDDSRVPLFVIEYILYHEMLHLKTGTKRQNGRVIYHSAEFRREERRFAKFDEANAWLKEFVSRTRRRRKR